MRVGKNLHELGLRNFRHRLTRQILRRGANQVRLGGRCLVSLFVIALSRHSSISEHLRFIGYEHTILN